MKRGVLNCKGVVSEELFINQIQPIFRDPTYLKIVQRFEERKQAPYSIHQVALMGASEGKGVGEWFGPNTVAQVLK